MLKSLVKAPPAKAEKWTHCTILPCERQGEGESYKSIWMENNTGLVRLPALSQANKTTWNWGWRVLLECAFGHNQNSKKQCLPQLPAGLLQLWNELQKQYTSPATDTSKNARSPVHHQSGNKQSIPFYWFLVTDLDINIPKNAQFDRGEIKAKNNNTQDDNNNSTSTSIVFLQVRLILLLLLLRET